jgi:hypothetical protein
MAITPGPGYKVDPSNANAVVPISEAAVNNPNENLIAPSATPAPAPKSAAASYASVTPQQQAQPPAEPAVVTSATIPNTIADNKTTLSTMQQKGTYQGQDGSMYYSDGSLVPAPMNAIPNPDGSWSANGQQFKTGPNYIDNAEQDPYVQNINDMLSSLKASTDMATKGKLDAIHQQYEALIAQQTDQNNRVNATRQNALLIGGASRYAPMAETSIMSAQVSVGLQEIQKLEAAEQSALASAQAAGEAQDQQLMDKALGMAQQIRQEKQAAATKINTQLLTAANAQQKQQEDNLAAMKAAADDTQIADAVSQGITNPGDLLKALNYDQNGKQVGSFTADQISKTLKAIAENTGAAGIKGLTGDVGNFYTLKQTPGALPASILAMPEDKQLAAYISMVNGAKKGNLAGSPAAGASSSGGATQPAAPDAMTIPGVPDTLPVVGFDLDNGPNQHDQATYLAALPGGETGKLGALIKGLSDYSINPNTFPNRLFKGQTGITSQQIIPLVKQYDPSYNENNFTAAQAMQKSITSGTYSQVVNSANTLIAHLKLLSDSAHKLPGGSGVSRSIPLINKGANSVVSAFGSPAVTNFKTAVNAVGSEAAKIYKGTGVASEEEIKSWQKSVGPDSSDEQIQGAVRTIVQLMAGRLSSLSDSYRATMGKPYSRALLTPTSAKILTDLGVDPTEVDPLYGNSPAAQIGSSHTLSDFLSSAPAPTVSPIQQPKIDWSAAHI